MYSIDNTDHTNKLVIQVAKLKHRVDTLETVIHNAKPVLTLAEAAIYTGISKSTLYKLTSSRAIPFYKPNGKVILFEKDELLAWIRRNKVEVEN